MKESIDNISNDFSFIEKCRLLTGSATLSSAAIEKLCIPSINISDGPPGIRSLPAGRCRVVPAELGEHIGDYAAVATALL